MYSLPCLDPRSLPSGKFFPTSNLSSRLSAFPLIPFSGKTENCSHLHPHHSHDNDSGNLQIGILSLVFLQGEKLQLNFLLSFSFFHKTLEETINW